MSAGPGLLDAGTDQYGSRQYGRLSGWRGVAPSRDRGHSHGQQTTRANANPAATVLPPGGGCRLRTEVDVTASQEADADSRRDGHQTGNDTDEAGGEVSRVASTGAPG